MRKLNGARRILVASAVVLIACAVLIELRGVDNAFVGDDWEHLYVASTTTSVQGVIRLFDPATPRFVRPVHWLSTLLLSHAFGLAPAPFHILGIMLDITCAALLAWLVWRLQTVLHPPRQGIALLLPLGVAVLFLVNPRHHEAVLWHAAVNDVFAAFFRLLTLHVMLSWLQGDKKSPHLLVLSLATTMLAFLSKESAVIVSLDLAVMIIFVEYCRGADRRQIMGTLAALAPFFVLSAIWTVMYVVTIPGADIGLGQRTTIEPLRATPYEFVLRLIQYINANWVPVSWLARHPAILVVEGVLWLAIVVAAIRGKRALLLFALAWTVLAILPYLVIQYSAELPSEQASLLVVSGDRYLYYSSAGAALLLLEMVLWLMDEAKKRLSPRLVLVAASAACAVLLMISVFDLRTYATREAEWDIAGKIGSSILRQVQALLPDPSADSLLCLANMPRTEGNRWVMGAWVDRALYLMYGKSNFSVRAAYLPAPWDPPSAPLATSGCSIVLSYNAKTGVVRAQ